MHHLTHLQVALSRSGDRVQEVVGGGALGDPNSSHTCTRAHGGLHPCITNQTRAKQQPKTLVPPTFRLLCCCRVANIYSSARRGGGGRGLRAPLRNSEARSPPAAAGATLHPHPPRWPETAAERCREAISTRRTESRAFILKIGVSI